jgi:hypothetical protein
MNVLYTLNLKLATWRLKEDVGSPMQIQVNVVRDKDRPPAQLPPPRETAQQQYFQANPLGALPLAVLRNPLLGLL